MVYDVSCSSSCTTLWYTRRRRRHPCAYLLSVVCILALCRKRGLLSSSKQRREESNRGKRGKLYTTKEEKSNFNRSLISVKVLTFVVLLSWQDSFWQLEQNWKRFFLIHSSSCFDHTDLQLCIHPALSSHYHCSFSQSHINSQHKSTQALFHVQSVVTAAARK